MASRGLPRTIADGLPAIEPIQLSSRMGFERLAGAGRYHPDNHVESPTRGALSFEPANQALARMPLLWSEADGPPLTMAAS